MDETFTGMIVSQHSLADFIREARRDIAAPLYYSLMWLLPLNDSDFAMRLPSWAFMITSARRFRSCGAFRGSRAVRQLGEAALL